MRTDTFSFQIKRKIRIHHYDQEEESSFFLKGGWGVGRGASDKVTSIHQPETGKHGSLHSNSTTAKRKHPHDIIQ